MNFYNQPLHKINKRKSQPKKAFPRGYRDVFPGVTIQIGFGDLGGFVIRSLSSPTTSSCSDSGSLPSSPKSFARDETEELPALKGVRKRIQRNIVYSPATRKSARRT
jgi:hypothetical protein